MRTIPLRNDGTENYDLQLQLDGREWTFQCRWLERRRLWSLTILDDAGTTVLGGQGLLTGLQLLGRAIGGPPGQLLVLPTADGIAPAAAPELQSFGDALALVYFEQSELADLGLTGGN